MKKYYCGPYSPFGRFPKSWERWPSVDLAPMWITFVSLSLRMEYP